MRAHGIASQCLVWIVLAWSPLSARDVSEVALPALTIDGRAAEAHTQGMVAVGGGFFITARRDDVAPRRSLLVSTHGGDSALRVWDITPQLTGDRKLLGVLDHPGGLDSDGERLWIPLSHSRRDGKTLVRAYAIAPLLAGDAPSPVTEFFVDDHIGALAVSKRRGELYGANWDTRRVYVWNLKGEPLRSFARAEFVTAHTTWSNAVQDWKIEGNLLVAGGLDKSPDRPRDRPRAVVQVIDLSTRALVKELRLPAQPGVGDLTREGMSVHAGSLWLLPEDLGAANRMFRLDAKPLGLHAAAAAAAAEDEDEAYWKGVSSGRHVPEFHFILSRQDWQAMRPERRGPEPGRPPRNAPGVERRFPRSDRDRPPPPDRFPGRNGPPPRRRGPPPPGGDVKYNYVEAAMVVDGRRFDGIGLRFKGNSSYRSSGDSPRKPFKVDTNRFTKGLKFHGRTKLNFSNAFKDPTYMKEKLGYEVYRAAGLPTPEVGWARLYLTVEGLYEKQLLGLYVIIEQVDEKFVEKHFGATSRESLLMKPERLPDWLFLGRDVSAYKPYGIKEGADNTRLFGRFVEFLELIEGGTDEEFADQIGDRLDLEGLASYLAATALLSSLDSYVGTPHNYYLLLDQADGKVKLLPWDVNEAFATFAIFHRPEELIRWDIERPWVARRRILERLFAIESFRELYLMRVRQLLETSFSETRLLSRLDEIRPIVEPNLADDPFGAGIQGMEDGLEGGAGDEAAKRREPRAVRGPRRPFPPAVAVKPFIRERIASVKRQLAGEEKGVRLEGRRRRR